MQVKFNVECDACLGGFPRTQDTRNVLELVRDNSDLDYAILTVEGQPATDWGILSVDPSPPGIGEAVYQIDHAGGGTKGYVDGQVTSVGNHFCLCTTLDPPFLCGDCLFSGFRIDAISAGGASGAPVFRGANHCVLGLMHCSDGLGSCEPGLAIPISAVMNDAALTILSEGGHFAPCPPIREALSRPVTLVMEAAPGADAISRAFTFVVESGSGSDAFSRPFSFSFIPCLGDLNGDGVIGVSDFLGLLTAWGPGDNASDLNLDGRVDVLDFILLLVHWGGCANAAAAENSGAGSPHGAG